MIRNVCILLVESVFSKQSESILADIRAKCRIFALAFEKQARVKAAAQHSSNKFGSAFALHFTCSVKITKCNPMRGRSINLIR